MLERAPSSAECSTHLLLRSLERPIRTRQVLGPAFWRHGGEPLDVPAWWPVYLSGIRRNNDNYNVLPQLCSTAATRYASTEAERLCDSGRRPAASIDSGRSFRQPSSMRSRPFTVVASRKAQAVLPVTDPIPVDITRYASGRDVGQRTKAWSAANDLVRKSTSQTGSEAALMASPPSQSRAITGPDYEKAWTLFIQSGHKQEISSSMLHLLAQSSQRVHLIHALRTFEFIPLAQRTSSDYETGIQVASKLKRYKTAILLVTQALNKGFGDNAYFRFMAYCVEHKLWNTLAALWKSAGSAGRAALKSKQSNSKSKSPNMAGKYSFHFDTIIDLSGKVVSLADLLVNGDPVLAANQEVLTEICKRLAYIAAESQEVMAITSSKTALALFNVQKLLKFNSKLHLVALGALMRMRERGTRSDFALLIYRNFRTTHPTYTVPRWVYGALIGICAAGRQDSRIYTYLFDEIKNQHGYIDPWSYQQVLAACARQGDVAVVFQIFRDFCKSNKPRDLRDVHHLLNVFAVVGDCENTQFQFNRLEAEFGFRPDIVSWTILLLAHARSPHPESAYEVFESIKAAGVTPNTISWSILISVAAKRGDTRRARQIYEQAQQQNVPGSIHMVGSMVESLLLNNEAEQAEAIVIKASQLDSKEPTIRLWNSLLRYYAFRSDGQSINRVQTSMQRFKVEPDSMTYAALMTALVVKGQTASAMQLFHRVCSTHQLRPTEFHYSILIHGYAQEGNRDSAMLAYQEMLTKFPRASASAKLAMLRLHLRRDRITTKSIAIGRHHQELQRLQGEVHQLPWRGLDHLADILLQDPRLDAASSIPSPGFGRRSPRDGLDSIYFGTLVSFLQQNMAHRQSTSLLNAIESLAPASSTGLSLTLANLTLRLNAAAEDKSWTLVDDIWGTLCKKGFALCSDSHYSRKPGPSPPSSGATPHGLTLLSSDENAFKPMIPIRISQPQILRAHRFALSWPLSVYLQALDSQGLYDEVKSTVQKFESIGFSMSSRNWNRYIQILSRSPSPEHQIHAFEMFEMHMMHSPLNWNMIRRGKCILPLHGRRGKGKSAARAVMRRKLERSNPDLLVPSYFTMVHLAALQMRVSQAAGEGQTSPIEELKRQAPKTLRFVQQMPYFADRVQGVLLRGRTIKGDRHARPRMTRSDRTTLEQNKLDPLDQLPPSVLEKAKRLLALGKDGPASVRGNALADADSSKSQNLKTRLAVHIFQAGALTKRIDRNPLYSERDKQLETSEGLQQRIHSQEASILPPYIELAEEAFGEIHRGRQFLSAQGRQETSAEADTRILRQKVDYLDRVQAIRKALQARMPLPDEISHESSHSTDLKNTAVPSSTTIENLVDALINNRGAAAVQQILESRGYGAGIEGVSNNGANESARSGQNESQISGTPNQSSAIPDNFKTFDTIRRYDPPVANPQDHQAHAHAARLTDRRVLLRRVGLRYQNQGRIPTEYQSRRRGAWSINKAQRRNRLRDKQLYSRWKSTVRREGDARAREERVRQSVEATGDKLLIDGKSTAGTAD